MKSSNFFSELKRRNVYKVAVAYAVPAWLVIQVASIVLPTFHAAEWTVQVIIALVAIGFPAAAAIPKLENANAMQAPPFVAAFLGYAYGPAGDKTKALAMIEEIKKKGVGDFVPPFNLALVYLGLGDHARVLDYLEQAQAADSQWMTYLKVDRIVDPLRADPRFIALMKKCHFER